MNFRPELSGKNVGVHIWVFSYILYYHIPPIWSPGCGDSKRKIRERIKLIE